MTGALVRGVKSFVYYVIRMKILSKNWKQIEQKDILPLDNVKNQMKMKFEKENGY